MDDTIYRQVAIDALNKLDVSDGIGISSVACKLQEEAIRSIGNLPSAQPEHLQTVMKKIKEKYEKGMNTPCINKPMAWALYETWKEYDR